MSHTTTWLGRTRLRHRSLRVPPVSIGACRSSLDATSTQRSRAPALRQVRDRITRTDGIFCLLHNSHAEFVEVVQQIKWIKVNAECSSPFELILAVASRQQPYPERSRALRSQQVPNAVPYDEGVPDIDFQPRRGGNEQVRVRFSVLHIIAGDERNIRIYSQESR